MASASGKARGLLKPTPLRALEQHANAIEVKPKEKSIKEKPATTVADIAGLVFVTKPASKPATPDAPSTSAAASAAAAASSPFAVSVAAARRHPRQLTVLVAAVQKKLNGKPMLQILKRLVKFPDLRVMALDERMLQEVPIEEWPLCDVLIAFDAKGYPLEKVIAYKNLTKPWVLNNLEIQLSLRDRRNVYITLREKQIPVAPHIIISCDRKQEGEFSPDEVTVDEHGITAGGFTLKKPFVEKPVNGDDHDVFIYFAPADGGGAQHLFRKTDDCCSVFLPGHNTLREGSFIYEQFIPTDGFDIKVYTVGDDYFHAEGRKAPVVDGRVLRDADGKELRCPISLTFDEKLIAQQIISAFGQRVCGFDLLRSRDRSYVCDVNGFSFVKRAPKYYDDTAQIIHRMIVRQLFPSSPTVMYSLTNHAAPSAKVGRESQVGPELRCVIAITRHAERTPKQKLKLLSSDPLFLAMHKQYAKKPTAEVKLKAREQLTQVIDCVRQLIARAASDAEFGPGEGADSDTETDIMKLKLIVQVLTAGPISGINRKVQLKPLAFDEGSGEATQLLFIIKWGGEITPAGLKMAEEAGVAFRHTMYPSADHEDDGAGLLRLHSTFRHDLKIYSSDEGRVQVTAAAFAKGLLQLENDIPPILASLVRKDGFVNTLLDDVSAAAPMLHTVKRKLHDLMQRDCSADELLGEISPILSPYCVEAMKQIGNPRRSLEVMRGHITNITSDFRAVVLADRTLERYKTFRRWQKLDKDFYDAKTDRFDISKLPDIYDSIVYDLRQSDAGAWLEKYKEFYRLARAFAEIVISEEYGMLQHEKLEIARLACKNLSEKVLHDLLTAAGVDAVRSDFGSETAYQLTPNAEYAGSRLQNTFRNVRTRLYFTSESHIHGMVNLLRFGPFKDVTAANQLLRAAASSSPVPLTPSGNGRKYMVPNQSDTPDVPLNDALGGIPELSFMSQITCRLFENRNLPLDHDDRFFVEWCLSPGQIPPSPENLLDGTPVLAERMVLQGGLPLKEVMQAFADPLRGAVPSISPGASVVNIATDWPVPHSAN